MNLTIIPNFKNNSLKRLQSPSFGWVKSEFEDDKFEKEIKDGKSAAIVHNELLKHANNPLLGSYSYDKIAKTYEDLNQNKMALDFLKKGLEQKKKTRYTRNDLFDSYVNLQRISERMGMINEVEILEHTLENIANSNFDFSKKNLPKEDEETLNLEFAKISFNISKKLLANNKNKEALDIYNNSYEILNANLQNEELSKVELYEIGADILSKNNRREDANKFYEKAIDYGIANTTLSKKDKVRISLKIAENLMMDKDNSFVNDILNSSELKTDQPELLIQNLVLRAYSDIQKGKMDFIPDYITYGTALEKAHELKPNNDLLLLKALMRKNDGDLEGSSDSCIMNLKDLKTEDKIYSPVFVKTAIVLASNNYDKYLLKQDSKMENLNQSLNLYRTALKISNQIEDNHSSVIIYKNLAEIFLNADDVDDSTKEKEYYKKAEEYLLNITESKQFDFAKINNETKCDVLSLLGKVYRKQNLPEKAAEAFKQERKILRQNNASNEELDINLNNIIKSYEDSGKVEKAERLLRLLKDGTSSNYDDLFLLAEKNMIKGDFEKANSLYKKAMQSSDSTESEKAIALFHLGASKMKTENFKSAFADMEKGCEQLESIVIEQAKTQKVDKKTSSLLYNTLDKLGELYYFEKSDYNNAARTFAKIQELAGNKNIPFELGEEENSKLHSRVAASFYKAQDYDKATNYYAKYIESLTKEDFRYSKLDEAFVDKIVDNNKTDKCLKVAVGLEMLGVANVKNKQFQAASNCFETSLKIRRIVQGEKIGVANDYRALSRLAMVWKGRKSSSYNSSRDLLKNAIEIMRSQLGSKDERVQKEEKFLSEYFGLSLASGGKYATRIWGLGMSKIAPVLNKIGIIKENIDVKDNYTEEIIKDFHLVYGDLAICE